MRLSEVQTYREHGQNDRELTPRQREILVLLCDGMPAKQIAARLNVSQKTVDFHKAQLSERLGIHSTAHLVRYAVRNGIIEP